MYEKGKNIKFLKINPRKGNCKSAMTAHKRMRYSVRNLFSPSKTYIYDYTKLIYNNIFTQRIEYTINHFSARVSFCNERSRSCTEIRQELDTRVRDEERSLTNANPRALIRRERLQIGKRAAAR